ncbi:hypothetical protein K6119_01510 [Paracrocinitomix mangrovi]|uniref:imelysin family protein n=1 Tax=Paracrocinitomix mangrovi TaxID=2862509 RepID=UPI001C8DB38E|nr:imelysin family protein [Paracrocinitomix mangrovi]UKN02194.1 hypothetical protein K6119_01510 [Paracrocinitomix mangrovi]
MRFSFLVFLIFLIGFSSCKKSRFKRSDFLQEFYDYKVKPDLLNLNSQVFDLQNKWLDYLNNQSNSNFDLFKDQFDLTFAAIDNATFYNLGDISQTYIYNKFNKSGIDTVNAWGFYADNTVVTTSAVASLPNNQKGFYFIEYLVFSDFSQDSLSSLKYQSWISSCIEDLSNNVGDLEFSWSIYEKNFTSNTDDGVSGSFNVVCNRIIHSLEDLIDKRLNPVLEAMDTDQIIGGNSGNGLKSVKRLFFQLEAVYLGNGDQQFNAIHNYLKKKDKKLADSVTERFSDISSDLNSMNNEMEWYLLNDVAALESLKQKLTDLLVVFKLDVTNAMGVILTFGDTDGD